MGITTSVDLPGPVRDIESCTIIPFQCLHYAFKLSLSSFCFATLLKLCAGSVEKANEVISTFFQDHYRFSMSIFHVVKLTGITSKQAKELRSFLSHKRVSTVNSTTLLIVIALLAAKHKMTLRERQLALFRIIDHENNQKISGDGLEILLYRVSTACSRILGTHLWKSSQIKHLKKMIFRDLHKSDDVNDAFMSLEEYLRWSDEVVRGGDGNNKDKCDSSWESFSVEDIEEYFSSFLNIFASASAAVEDGLVDLKTTFSQEYDALNLTDTSPFEDKEHGEYLQNEYKCAVRAMKTETQRTAGASIEALARHRKEKYTSRLAAETAAVQRKSIVESVREESEMIAKAVCCVESLENYHIMMIEEIIHTKKEFDKLSTRCQAVKMNIDKVMEIINQLKLRRSLLSEKLNVFSGELHFANSTVINLQKEKKIAAEECRGNKMNGGSDIRTNRLEAKLEIVNSEKRRLKKSLDECATESGVLMSDQLNLEKQLLLLQTSHADRTAQLNAVKCCYVFLTTKEAKVDLLLQAESATCESDLNDPEIMPETDHVSDNVSIEESSTANHRVMTIKAHAGQYASLIDLACYKVEDMLSTRNKRETSAKVEREVIELRAEQRRVEAHLKECRDQVTLEHVHVADARSQAKQDAAALEMKKKTIIADIEHAKHQEEQTIQRAEEVSRQVQSKVADLRSQLEQQSRSMISQHFVSNLFISTELSRSLSPVAKMRSHNISEEEVNSLRENRDEILMDIERAKLRMVELNTAIVDSEKRAKQAAADADKKVLASQEELKVVSQEVTRLREMQSKVQNDVKEAEIRAALVRQEADESRLRADKLSSHSRAEMEQLRRDHEAAEAQVEAVVEMTENMIIEAEQEKARLTREREAALESAHAARLKVEALEAEVLSLRSVNDNSMRRKEESVSKITVADNICCGTTRSRSPKNEGSIGEGSSRAVWEKCADDEGDTFYYNRVTEESTWRKPSSGRVVDGGASVSSEMLSYEDKHFRRIGEGDEEYWMNDDTGSILEDSKLQIAKKSVSESLSVAKEKERELDRLAESTRVELEKKAADEEVARHKAIRLAEDVEAARVKAEQSVLEANAQVEWAQLLVLQSEDEIAQLNLEQSSLVKDMETAETKAMELDDQAEGTKFKAEVERSVAEEEVSRLKEEHGELHSLIESASQELSTCKKIDQRIAIEAATSFREEFVKEKRPLGERAVSRHRISYDWEECFDEDDDVFYYNKRTEESSWTKPDVFETASSRYRHDITDDDEDIDAVNDPEKKTYNGKQLTLVDQGDGMTYWMNDSTGSICEDLSSRRHH